MIKNSVFIYFFHAHAYCYVSSALKKKQKTLASPSTHWFLNRTQLILQVFAFPAVIKKHVCAVYLFICLFLFSVSHGKVDILKAFRFNE